GRLMERTAVQAFLAPAYGAGVQGASGPVARNRSPDRSATSTPPDSSEVTDTTGDRTGSSSRVVLPFATWNTCPRLVPNQQAPSGAHAPAENGAPASASTTRQVAPESSDRSRRRPVAR